MTQKGGAHGWFVTLTKILQKLWVVCGARIQNFTNIAVTDHYLRPLKGQNRYRFLVSYCCFASYKELP